MYGDTVEEVMNQATDDKDLNEWDEVSKDLSDILLKEAENYR